MASFSQARGTLQLGSRARDGGGSSAGRADTPPPGTAAAAAGATAAAGGSGEDTAAAAGGSGEGNREELVRLLFAQYSPSSSGYSGLDTEVALVLSRLVFYCNRPTVAALMVFGADLAAINSAMAAPADAQQQVRCGADE